MVPSIIRNHLRFAVAGTTLAAIALLSTGSLALAKPEASGRPEFIPGKYIVVFNDNVDDPETVSQQLAFEHGLTLEHTYRNALHGFSGNVPAGKLDAITNDSRVAFVSQDALVTALGKPPSPSLQPAQTVPNSLLRTGAQVSGLTGQAVTVAVIDTGIDLKHPDLAANIVADTSCITGKRTGADENGHGTHVAGTIAALNNTIGTVGIAPQAKLAAVKVLNSQGTGTWSSIICGLDWVTANAATYNIKVANLSLGGSGTSDNNCGLTNNDALHQAICRTRDAGITLVVAAGNSAANTANSVPAAYNDAVITVSALADSDGNQNGFGAPTSYGADDTFASFSNFGFAVDLGAPGVNIFSTWKGGSYNTLSGTSMASPHVAGAAALYLEAHPGSTWIQVRDGLVANGEILNAGHTDPSGLHAEPVLNLDRI